MVGLNGFRRDTLSHLIFNSRPEPHDIDIILIEHMLYVLYTVQHDAEE